MYDKVVLVEFGHKRLVISNYLLHDYAQSLN